MHTAASLKKLVLQSHIALRLKTDTSTEDVGESTSLLGKSIDDRSSRRSQWGLEHVAENAEHAVEVLELLGGDAIVRSSFPLDTGHHLSDQDKVNDQWRSKKRVLADIEETEICQCCHKK
jgi:hypothetical protein